jgi:hypothetical protein
MVIWVCITWFGRLQEKEIKFISKEFGLHWCLQKGKTRVLFCNRLAVEELLLDFREDSKKMENDYQLWIRIGIEGVAGLVMLGGIVGIFYERTSTGRGIGVRVIQLATVLLVMPIILILALEGILDNQTTAALIGAIVGYILSGIGKDEPSKKI